MPYDFVAIGDIVTDAFIRLREAEVHKNMRHETREICMSWGTKIPYDGVMEVSAVGNCANAAVAAARIGSSSALVTNQGDDEIGKKNLKALESNRVATEFVTSHKTIKSNYHYVLSFKGERTILVKHEVYPYALPDIGEPKWLYLTSLGETSTDFHDEIADYLDKHPNINLVFQPGTFQIQLGKDVLSRVYNRAKIFFCNVEEAQQILDTESRDIKKLVVDIRALGPEIVCITDGPNGAYAYDSKSDELWRIGTYPDPKPPIDRTGAGDAFSSTFAIALALGKTVPEALSWGPINSMNVVQYYGAQEGLLTREKLEEYLAKAPAEYKAKKI